MRWQQRASDGRTGELVIFGLRRYLWNRFTGYPHKDYGARGFRDRLACMIQGTFAEGVVHDLTGLPWHNPVGKPDGGDVDVGSWDVKSSTSDAYLYLDDGDAKKGQVPFLAVAVDIPFYRVVGWAWGWEVMQDRWRYAKGQFSGWRLPASSLRPWRPTTDPDAERTGP